jgi:hypothetical protein
VTSIVEDPELLTELGVKVAPAPVGRPVALRVTVPLYPPK